MAKYSKPVQHSFQGGCEPCRQSELIKTAHKRGFTTDKSHNGSSPGVGDSANERGVDARRLA